MCVFCNHSSVVIFSHRPAILRSWMWCLKFLRYRLRRMLLQPKPDFYLSNDHAHKTNRACGNSCMHGSLGFFFTLLQVLVSSPDSRTGVSRLQASKSLRILICRGFMQFLPAKTSSGVTQPKGTSIRFLPWPISYCPKWHLPCSIHPKSRMPYIICRV